MGTPSNYDPNNYLKSMFRIPKRGDSNKHKLLFTKKHSKGQKFLKRSERMNNGAL